MRIERFEKIIKILINWDRKNWLPKPKIQKLWKDLLSEIQKLKYKTEERINLNNYVDFLDKLERNELYIMDFVRSIEKFNGPNWWDFKEKRPDLLKKVIKDEVQKFEYWQKYRRDRFWTWVDKLDEDKKDFIESISSSINFQYWNKIEFKTFEEITLFFNNN